MVQDQFPDLVVSNFGTGGQGGCQSLMRIKDLIEKRELKNSTIVYGFYYAHERRNIADPVYAWYLARASEYRSAFMPYCWIDEEGELIFMPAEEFDFQVYFSEKLAVSKLIEEAYYYFKSLERRKREREVTELILLEMKKLVEESDNQLVVLTMRMSEQMSSHYSSFLKANDIAYVDGNHPMQHDPSFKLSDGHPNEKMYKFWMEKLTEFFHFNSPLKS